MQIKLNGKIEDLSAMIVMDFNKLGFVYGKETITEVLNLVEKKDDKIEKLKKQNKLVSKEHEERFNEFEAEIEKKNKTINNAITEIETLRTYFSKNLQPDFIRILEILKDKKL